MAVLEPLKVSIIDLPPDTPSEVRVPNFPADETKGHHVVPLEKTMYIEQSDFREVIKKNNKELYIFCIFIDS